MVKWWVFGLIGMLALFLPTVIIFISAINRHNVPAEEWGKAAGVAAAVAGMGFLCGLIAWAGQRLHTYLGMLGDALVGAIVMLVYLTCCMLLFEPELLNEKFSIGGLPMYCMGAVIGLAGGAKVGYDLRKWIQKQSATE